MPPAFRVGLIGYGAAGAFFHGPLISTTPGLTLDAIVTRNPERQADAHRRHPGARILDTPDALWNPREFDVVVVASPNRTHVPFARAAIDAGLAVVVDKPLAPTAAEGRDLVRRAAGRGVLLTVFHNRRWDGDFLTVERLLGAGAFGQPLRFESRFDRWRPGLRDNWRERSAPEDAGGLLNDLGSHLIDQALVLFGPAREVYAELDRRREGSDVDDDVFVALRHTSGVRSHLSASVLAAQLAARMRVFGTVAAYTKFGLDVQEAPLRAGELPNRPDWGEEPPERWGLFGQGDAARPERTERGDYPRFYAQLVAALRGQGTVPVDPMDAVAVLEVIQAARVSSAEGRIVTPNVEAP